MSGLSSGKASSQIPHPTPRRTPALLHRPKVSAPLLPHNVRLLQLRVAGRRPFSPVCPRRGMLPAGGDPSCSFPLCCCTRDTACAPPTELLRRERLRPCPPRLPQLLPRHRSSHHRPGPVCVLPSGDGLFFPSAASVPQPWVRSEIFSYERPQSSPPQAVPAESEQWRPVQEMAVLRHRLDMARPGALGFAIYSFETH